MKLRINRALEATTGYRLVAGARGRPRRGVPVGLVEEFGAAQIRGWVAAPPDLEPIRVALAVNGHEVDATWATDGSPTHGKPELRSFDFAVRDLWAYCRQRDRLTIRVDGQPLPIVGHGMYRTPARNGPKDLATLRGQLASGYVFGHNGSLRLSKRLDVAWQRSVMDLYARVRAVLSEQYGYDAFLIYGSLLGAVREGGVIGHDHDFDAAYLSRHTNGRSAADELREVAFRLIDLGFDVEGKRTALHIHDHSDRAVRIDLFHLYFDDAGSLQFPFGVASTSEIASADWRGTREIEFCGAPALVPVNAEQIVAHIYGPGWQSPKPGFSWPRDRVKRGKDGILPRAYGEEVYWANFYARKGSAAGSPFFEALVGKPGIPNVVVDVGCGDGRDSLAFAASGRTVLGLDRSEVAIRNATARAADLGLDGRAGFAVCDLADVDAVRKHLASVERDPSESMLLYLRFLLHTITEEVQDTLLASLSRCARRGDQLAAEFRTDRDEKLQKTFGGHYRRYQSGTEFGIALRERYGFDILEEEEGQGLSPYGDEDPYLYRVLAVRR